MKAALDCYRLLGLPPKAALEQVQQAYRDRLQSLPRREYSDASVNARKRLLERAYNQVIESIQRRSHQQPESSPTAVPPKDQSNPESGLLESPLFWVDTSDERDFAGLLLLLCELGDFRKVLQIAQSHYEGDNISLNRSLATTHNPLDGDVILSIAVSYLELGREYWKQGQYSAAARSLETAQEILLREGLFVSLRSEIQLDLFRLRPYRILELMAAPDYQTEEHQRGIQLLQEMLEARRGIDGVGQDSSGLSIDEFLRFIQQLRTYMTTAEQQALFEDEARRPSSVACYLAIYALIARGFSQRQPALIRRAKGLLIKISAKQDIYLEQAVCALLLGQTEEATMSLEKSTEYDQISFIRQCSEGSPDLLPGLCLYSERWLQEEVYPHFRDLLNQVASLKDYFADEQVQAYLEELPATSSISSDWTVTSTTTTFETRNWEPRIVSPVGNYQPRSYQSEQTLPPYYPATLEQVEPIAPRRTRRQTVLERNLEKNAEPEVDRQTKVNSVRVAASNPRHRPTSSQTPKPENAVHRGKLKIKWQRFLTVVGLALGLFTGTIALSVWAWRSLSSPSKAEAITPLQQAFEPLVSEINSNKLAPVAVEKLDKEAALRLIESWQAIKSRALGSTHEIELIDTILVDPVLSEWKSRAKELKNTNSYLQYISKATEIERVSTDGSRKARVVAKISETRNFFSNGNLDQGASKIDAKYTVEYELVRKDQRWMIREMLVSE
ncbi:MAG: IMS domain-containing protein [Pseudanabaenaceae cyanobacterium]